MPAAQQLVTWLVMVSVLGLAGAVHAETDFDQAMNERYQVRDLPGLQQRLAEATDDELDTPAGFRWQAWLAMAGQDFDEAESLVDRGLALDPNHVDLILLKAGLGIRDLADAGAFSAMRAARSMRRDLERAVEIDPDHVVARLSLAQYYINAPRIAGGGQAKADEQLEAIRALDESNYHGLKGQMAMVSGALEVAVEHFQRSRSAGGRNDWILSQIIALQQLEDWDRVRALLDEVLTEHPDHAMAWYQLGRTEVLAESGAEHGIAAFRRFLELPEWPGDPSRAAAWWRIGQLHQQGGEMALAREAFRRSLELEPDFQSARESLDAIEG